jgi:periplasmic protein TonB
MRLEEKPPPAQRPEEPKDVKAQVISPGEKTVMQVAPGVGDAETGVAIAGARVGDGSTEIGGSMPGGTGTGKGYGYGGEGVGPVDAQFGRGDGPRFAYREMPDYPYAARRLGKEGKVLLALYIDHKGKLEKVEVIEVSDQMFVEAALEAVRKSRFHPAKRHGVAVRSRSILPIRFGF